MKQYREKPQQIWAIQYDGTNKSEILEAAGVRGQLTNDTIFVMTIDGFRQICNKGDYFVKIAPGRFDIVPGKKFEMTYEIIDGQ